MMKRMAGAIAIAVAAIAVAWWLGFVPFTQRELIRKAKVEAATDMLDPESAKFRRVSAGILKDGDLKGQAVVCGEINGKNANGAYAGYSRFVSIPDPRGATAIEPSSQYSDADLKSAQKQCKAGAESKTRDIEKLVAAKTMCEQVLTIMVDRQPVVAFQGVWENATCGSITQ
jgi:hypothetical protein